MNKTINKSLELFRKMLNISGEGIVKIEAVKDIYKMFVQDEGIICIESYSEVAEITYIGGYRQYVYIQGDSDHAACYDILKCIFGYSKWYQPKGDIVRNVYAQCRILVVVDTEEGAEEK